MHTFAAVLFSAFAIGGAPNGELLDFTATWCGPCQQMAPIVDRLHRQGFPVRKVDVDQNRELARQYGIQGIPAFVLVVNGRVVARETGLQSEARLIQMLSQIPKASTPAARIAKPAAPPEFDPGYAPESLIVENGVSASRDAVTMVSGQPAVGQLANNSSKTPSRLLAASQSKPQAAPKRGLLGLNLLGGSSKAETPLKKSPPSVVRANLDDMPLMDGDILTQDPLAASVRIRVSDKEGVNLGSGTIIESKVGRTLVLTCGHVFRNIQPNSVIEVDVWIKGQVETFVGKAVKYETEADLGLISIPTDNPLAFAAIADPAQKMAKGAAVQSVGCGQGNDPTLQRHMVTRVNRYAGPENIECTGMPVVGRSGGGLFNTNGELTGVCMAADTKERRGLYMGLGAIDGFLKRCRLNHLTPNSDDESTPSELEDDPDTMLADTQAESGRKRGLAALQEAMDESQLDDVTCLVRSSRSTQSGQRVVVLSAKKSGKQLSVVSK